LDVSPLGNPDKIKEWLAGMHDLGALRESGLLDYESLKHQLKVHLGLEKDGSSDFDPTEFQGDSASDDEQPVVVVKNTATKPKPQPAVDTVVDDEILRDVDSKPLSEDDFMAQIQGIDID
jgi:hypothetical protein